MTQPPSPTRDDSAAPSWLIRNSWAALTREEHARLVDACRTETTKFRRGEPSRDDFCVELLSRAVRQRDPLAWQAILELYDSQVRTWVRRHAARADVDEDDEYWVHLTFAKFATWLDPEKFRRFATLAALLEALKLCVHSVLLDEVRRKGRVRALSHGVLSDDTPDNRDYTNPGTDAITAIELWQIILAELRDDNEVLIANLYLRSGLKPGEIFRRYPDRFTGVADVYRGLRNILDRLRRHPVIVPVWFGRSATARRPGQSVNQLVRIADGTGGVV